MEKYFIITIDTEGDNLWEPYQTEKGVREITTKNAGYLPAFQKLCEQYRFIPTYLTNYEMALNDEFVRMAEKGREGQKLEIGMHMHAWNNPPLHELPYNPKGHNAYAGEYPERVLYDKMVYLTELLKERFQCPIRSHRGGRWYLDTNIVQTLKKLGYLADCSVTPLISWVNNTGNHCGGPDYTDFPNKAYEISAETLKEGETGLVEIPPTIMRIPPLHLRRPRNFQDLKSIIRGKTVWLRPDGNNLRDMLMIVHQYNVKGKYLEFMIHSSELMPGGSPRFQTEERIRILYQHLKTLFDEIKACGYEGIGLSDFAEIYSKKQETV